LISSQAPSTGLGHLSDGDFKAKYAAIYVPSRHSI